MADLLLRRFKLSGGSVLVNRSIASIIILFAASAVTVPVVAQQQLTLKEQLGKQLFFDNISQPAASMSCASCHDPKAGWVGAVAGQNVHGGVYRGASPARFGNRKPPTSAYSTYAPKFDYDQDAKEFVGGVFWDGRATGWKLGNPAADQAQGPFLNPVEQNMPNAKAVCQHVARSKYAKLFEHAWGPGSLDCSEQRYAMTYDLIGLSIAEYEGSSEMSPFSSKFDTYWTRCLAAGNTEDKCGLGTDLHSKLDPTGILTAQEFDGLIEFGEYCSACHVSNVSGPNGKPPLFTDFTFHNIGVPRNPENPFYKMDRVFLDDGKAINPQGSSWVDLGLGGFLRTVEKWQHLASINDGKFRTPTLRNVDQRPGNGFPKAYMHNGALKSLEEVVHFYNTRRVLMGQWPPPEFAGNLNTEEFEGRLIGDFGLDAEAEAAIVAFMKTLNDGWTPPKGKLK
jgi:cytochrome c peroxidase